MEGAGRRSFEASHLVALDFTLGIVLEVPVALVPTLDDLTELFCECGVKEVVYAQAGARCFCGVGGADAFLGRANAVIPRISFYYYEITKKKDIVRRTMTRRARPPSVRRRSGENQRRDVRDRK
jgi:hypothetical protein